MESVSLKLYHESANVVLGVRAPIVITNLQTSKYDGGWLNHECRIEWSQICQDRWVKFVVSYPIFSMREHGDVVLYDRWFSGKIEVR